MTDHQYASWKYAEDLFEETTELSHARRTSLEMGVQPVSTATGAALAQFAAGMNAASVLELGTGLGVSALWLARGVPHAHLTSIDIEPEYQANARELLVRAGVPTAKLRLIAGRAGDVLPRLNDANYDLVLVDADPASITGYIAEAMRIVRPGGTIAVPHALWGGRVADPTVRDATTNDFRDLVRSAAASSDTTSALLPVGDGLLLMTRR